MLEYICAQNKYVIILKNKKCIQKMIQMIFSLYEICSIY
jgi:hypothetical protein